MTKYELFIETIGWLSMFTFLFSIVTPKRINLHALGIFTSVTTGIYGYSHDATAIWVKWLVAFFFHLYMWIKVKNNNSTLKLETST